MPNKYHIGRDPASFGNVYCGGRLVMANAGGGISDALIELVDAANRAQTKDQPDEEWSGLVRNPHLGIPLLPNDVLIDWHDFKKLRDAAERKEREADIQAAVVALAKRMAKNTEDTDAGYRAWIESMGRTFEAEAKACAEAWGLKWK